jgi:DNA (cytosine-5)-methyltransferase 1
MSRMAESKLPIAPIWDDVRTLRGSFLPGPVDIICGGFPCQDVSDAGAQVGLAGERSGLWFEMLRLIGEIRPMYVFVENVNGLRGRGADAVVGGTATLGYDGRWCSLSAAAVGARQRRGRLWFLFADAVRTRLPDYGQVLPAQGFRVDSSPIPVGESWKAEDLSLADLGRRLHGIPRRVDRIKGLGNAVVPQAAREAFIRLSGLRP